MTPILVAACDVLHALAALVFIGHYILLSLLYLPVLSRGDVGAGKALGEISRASRPWMYAAILVFFLSGIVLMILDSNYQGIGNFGNPWAVLMLVKHLIILVMLVIGFWYNARQHVGRTLRSNPGDAQNLARFRRYTNAMSICGVLVLLLTALAQVEQG